MEGLFCWPCQLFRPGVSHTWTETGYTNMQGLCRPMYVLYDFAKNKNKKDLSYNIIVKRKVF